jgi:arsenate reductase
MAESILRELAGERFMAASAGLCPSPIHPMTLRVLNEAGLDTSALRPKDVAEFLGKAAVRYAITLCRVEEENCPHVYPFALQILYWPFEDPTQAEGSEEQRLQAFRNVRDQIRERLRQWLRDEAGTGPVER